MYLIQTVQTSWRPQLPLPKEVHLTNENIQRNHHHHLQQHPQEDDDIDGIQIIESDMERFHLNSKKDSSLNGSQLSNTSQNGSNSKKWSFGRLFRRKKEVESESSSEDDRKAGFMPNQQKYNRSSNNSITSANASTPHKKSSKTAKSTQRGSKLIGSGFDHIVMSPTNDNIPQQHHVDNEFFLPVETVPQQEPYYQNNLTDQQQQQQQQRLHHSQQYLPHVPQTQQQLMSRSAHSLDRRSARAKQRSIQKLNNGLPLPTTKKAPSSEEEEIISLNSSTFSKYRSDESIHSGGQGQSNGQSRRSRAARNERYYKRLSRDGEVSHGQVPVMYAQQPTQRWKTQPVPLSIYQAPQQQQAVTQQPQLRSSQQTTQYPKLRNTSSLQHMAPYVQWGQMQQKQPKNLQNSVNDSKRSISYDSHIHLQNASGSQHSKPLPPPPPPRDPMRRVNVSSVGQDGSSGDLRPMSYAFDQTGVPVLPTSGLNGRCVSDDKIWAQQPHYQSIHSLNIAPQHGSVQQQQANQPNRRFITRAERDAHPGKKSLPNGLDFHYVADATPRSRKPLHILDQTTFGEDIQEPPATGILRTTKSGLPTSPTKVKATEFWKRLEGSTPNISNTTTPIPAPRGRDVQRTPVVDNVIKPRSVSTPRVGELRAYPMPMYSEVYKPKQKSTPIKPAISPNTVADEVDAVVCGSLHIKPSQDNDNNYVEIRNKGINKANSMPNHYERRSVEMPTTPNKYEEYVNEKREQHHNPLFDAPQPPQRKLSLVPNIPQLSFPRKKPANLEEAINELEAIYRSLGLTEPEPDIKKERIPTPNDFEKYALAHADEYDDEDSPAGEPDPIRDDVAFRNIKLANLQHKSVENQPPFGIPIGPIVPAAQTDYLHVTPKRKDLLLTDSRAPDVIKDDLAVRALRKDPQEHKEKFQYPSGSLVKKNRATRTQSANIYALIQRDAAKPSGGDLRSYLELTKSIDRSGSMSDLHKTNSNNDIPTTLKLLQSLREQDKEQLQMKKSHHHLPFRHPSQGGAICQLPEKLCCTSGEEDKLHKPVPMPRKSLTPEPQHHAEIHKMEEALNKIAQDAQESSIKLTKELNELRKEAFITSSKPKRVHNEAEDVKLEQELQEIEKVSEAAKKCGKMLLDTLPDASAEGDEVALMKPRKLHKEDTLIKAIDQVSEAANKVCEKILKDIVTTEPPVIVQEAVKVTQKPKDVIKPKETSPLVMPTLIKKLDPIQSNNIEAIARRCMRQLSDLADNHDYDNLNQPELAVATTCNMDIITKDESQNDMTTSNLTETRKPPKPKSQQPHLIEDIDQIMKECEDQVRQQEIKEKKQPLITAKPLIQAPPTACGGSSTTTASFSSSSDCLAKSSSPSGSRRFSSSITSFNPYSSSDYIKSPSSDFHAPSTDPIKTFSSTSYDVQSTTSAATPNLTTNSAFSYSPSPPPLNLTPISNCSATIASNTQRGRSSSPSQYNSSEELAMIFGIEEKSKTSQKLHNNSGNQDNTCNSQEELLPEETLTKAASLKIAYYDNFECCSKTNDCLMLLTPNTCCSHTNKASSPTSSSSSSLSSKLETIPELCTEFKGYKEENKVPIDMESPLKLSTNFNRIYASKLQIFVDKLLEDQQSATPQLLTLCDSLSSLEETSSNPDSGNVSLADFPLPTQNVNNSLQLNSTFNTRFEVRNCFKTEISIGTSIRNELKSAESISSEAKVRELAIEEEFPPLPTEEELEESLKENLTKKSSTKEKQVLAKANHELMGERIILAREEIMAEVRALEAKALKRAKELREEEERSDSIFDMNSLDIKDEDKEESFSENYNSLKTDINDSLDIKEVKNHQRKSSFVMETPLLEMNIMEERINYEININNDDTSSEASLPYDQETSAVSSLKDLAFNCYELTKALDTEHKDNEETDVETKLEKVLNKENLCELNKALDKETMKQKLFKAFKDKKENKEALYKTDQEQVYKEALDEKALKENLEKAFNKNEQEQLKIALNKNEQDQEQEQSHTYNDTELRLRVYQPSPFNNNEQPSTSSKSTSATPTVLNVLGEQRQAVNGLTLLEHLVVACTLGLINTDDLFTLCLIIIGIIIVIAIALF